MLRSLATLANGFIIGLALWAIPFPINIMVIICTIVVFIDRARSE